MAYVQNQDDEDITKQGQGPISPTSGGVQTAAPSGVGSAGIGAGPSTTQQHGAGGQFASLTNYVNANQGNAAPIAQQISDKANQQFQTLQGQNQSALQDIQGQVAQGYTKNNPDLLAQEAANPTNFAQDPNNIASFQKLLHNVYSGPQTAESSGKFQNQQAAVNQATQTGQNLQSTEAGNKQLIGSLSQTPNASVTGLNEAILYKDPNATAQVQHAYDPFSQLTTQLSQGAGDINKQIGQAQNEAQTSNIASNKQLNDQFHGLNTQISNENQQAFNTANTNYQGLMNTFNNMAPNQALFETVNKDLAPGSGMGGTAKAAADMKALQEAVAAQTGQNLTPDQLKQLGVTSDQWGQLMNVQKQLGTPQFVTSGNAGMGSAWTPAQAINLNNWLQSSAPTQANFTSATPEEIAQGNALNQIYGQNQFSAPVQGTPYTNPTFDYNGLMSALNQGLGQVQTGTQQTADQVAAQQQAAYEANKGGGFFGNPWTESFLTGFLPANMNPMKQVYNKVVK